MIHYLSKIKTYTTLDMKSILNYKITYKVPSQLLVNKLSPSPSVP